MDGFLFEGRCTNLISLCSLSQKTVYSCSLCAAGTVQSYDNQRGYISSWKYISRHAQTAYHRSRLIEVNKVTEQQTNSMGDFEENNHMTTTDEGDSPSETIIQGDIFGTIPRESDLFELGFESTSNTPAYLHYEYQEKGLGARYLTAKAFGVNPNQVSLDEAKFCLQICTLLIGMTEKQKTMLATILSTAGNNGNKDLSIFKTIRLPTTLEDFDRLFLTGKNSILPNLPHPVPRSSGDTTHSFVSLKDILANEFGKAVSFDDYEFMSKVYVGSADPVPSISATQHAKNMLIQMKNNNNEKELGDPDVYSINLWLREWRDDFDPNNSKSSRNQVWCNTYTVCPPSEGNSNGSNTYFVGLSSKGDDHNEVEEFLAQELNSLSEEGIQLYHGGMRRIVHVRINKLLISVDRPERTSMFQVGDHNGTYSACWGYATSVDSSCKINHLPSCKECRAKREQRLLNLNPPSTNTESNVQSCPFCSNWNMEDSKFVFLAPSDYPQRYDSRDDAPLPPMERDLWYRIEDVPVIESENPIPTSNENPTTIVETTDGGPQKKRKKRNKRPNKRIYLRTVKLTVTWLRMAVTFATHNLRTVVPNGRAKQTFWTKGNFSAYLKTCGISNRLVDLLFRDSESEHYDLKKSLPVCWKDVCSLAKCHYAPMHMLFLGHMKSNIEMISNWLGKFNRLATFGKEVNKYLNAIRSLRATKYFNAQPLSTTKWGTGVWVSENYLLGARVWKFFLSLPSVSNNQLLTNTEYKAEWMEVVRFVHAMSMSFSRIMTNQQLIPNLNEYIMLYLDYMVVVDKILANSDRQKKNPNYLKSNSLGILSCAEAHEHMGPATLHWEGGWEGERKIQGMKPLLHIKRSTADWTKITLTKIYQHDTLEWMLRECSSETVSSKRDRSNDSLLKIYKSHQELEDACTSVMIISAFYGLDKKVYAAYRPVGESAGNTRKKVKIKRIEFDDEAGEMSASRCWTAPIKLVSEECQEYESVSQLRENIIDEVLMLLPLLSNERTEFKNMYYSVGNLWRERCKDGVFRLPMMDDTIFGDHNMEVLEFSPSMVVRFYISSIPHVT